VTVITVVVMGSVTGLSLKFYRSVKAADSAALVFNKIKFPAFKTELGKLRAQTIWLNTQIDQSAQGHVARDTGITIKM
jgi:hypothetical protein